MKCAPCVSIPPYHTCPLSSINKPFRFYLLPIPPSPHATCFLFALTPSWYPMDCSHVYGIPSICLNFFANHDPACFTLSSCPSLHFPFSPPFHLAPTISMASPLPPPHTPFGMFFPYLCFLSLCSPVTT